MAYVGLLTVGVYLALFLTGELTNVRALQCYRKIEYSCPLGVCSLIKLPSGIETGITECAPHENRCGWITGDISASVLGTGSVSVSVSAAGCVIGESSECIDTDDIQDLFPLVMTGINLINSAPSVSVQVDTFEACLCDENLCNSTVKCTLSVSLIITSFLFNLIF
ncbi:hypothetical protein HOLleu_24978 [Holothuria leucospilota]|uniref:Uncharacterized protein n=1 Tax=Holothuria leucospilota TaxID=206669 RepID=A0A9Q1BRY8_HOLLE|nr:hypothetical protein HOLleu_24978 [Holothuria leucospilota]